MHTTCWRIQGGVSRIDMYSDYCEECRKQFKTRHYSWFVCLKCHKKISRVAGSLEGFKTRIECNEELE